jgi:hypothetical protein
LILERCSIACTIPYRVDASAKPILCVAQIVKIAQIDMEKETNLSHGCSRFRKVVPVATLNQGIGGIRVRRRIMDAVGSRLVITGKGMKDIGGYFVDTLVARFHQLTQPGNAIKIKIS